MYSRRLELSVGAFVLLGALCLAFLALEVGGLEVGRLDVERMLVVGWLEGLLVGGTCRPILTYVREGT